MIGILLALTQTAQATTYNVRFCIQWDILFADSDESGFDDYFNTNSHKDALGAYYYIKIAGGAGITTGYAAESGYYAGCTSVVALDSGVQYDVYVYSKAEVNGNTVYVYDEDTSPALYSDVVWDNWSPTSSLPVTRSTVTEGGWVNLIAASSYAVHRNNGGMTSKTYTIYAVGEDDDDTTACTGETVGTGDTENCGGYIWMQPSRHDDRYVIVHEMGHRVARYANGDVSAHSDYTLAQTGTCEWSGHAMTSGEFSSATANEGIAHLYPAVTFNDVTDESGDCWFWYYKNVDWDNYGGPNSTIHWADCETNDHCDNSGESCGPIDGNNYLEKECVMSSYENRGVEYDWLRFWWDLLNEEGLTYDDALDIWATAEPNEWNANDDEGPHITDPGPQLYYAADTLGIGTEWILWATFHGVDN